MNDIPDKKTAEEADATQASTPETDRDEILDAEYLPEKGGDETVTSAPETWPELGAEYPSAPTAEESDLTAHPQDEVADATNAEELETKAEAAAKAIAKPANLRWDSMFLLLLTCITLVRLGYLYIVPLDLGADESYYWDWSRRLDLGYYDKPPMIAWINALSTMLLGVSAQAVRMPAVVFGALGLIGMYLCGRRMFNAEVAFWGLAAWLATPGTAALGLIMATDALLTGFWCLALYTLWRALEAQKANAFWWLLTMLLVGLGSLSTQMMLIFPLLLILYLLFSEDRKQLFSRWPWLMWSGSLLFLIPPLWWNFQHDWITVRHSVRQFEPVGSSMFDHFKTFGEFVAGQMGLVTPITWLLLLLLTVTLLLKVLKWSRQTRFLFIFGAVGLFAISGLSFRQSINPNWPVTFYPAALLLLAAWGREQVSAGFFDKMRGWFVPGIKLGIFLTLLAYLLPFAMQLSFLPLGKIDPTSRIKGWQELGQQVGETLQQQPRPEQTIVISPLRNYPAEVAFYSPGNPITYKWPGNPPRISSQYELWPGPVDKLGWDALILHDADSPLPNDLVNIFENVVPLGEKSIPTGAAGERRYHMWRGENLLSWPEWH